MYSYMQYVMMSPDHIWAVWREKWLKMLQSWKAVTFFYLTPDIKPLMTLRGCWNSKLPLAYTTFHLQWLSPCLFLPRYFFLLLHLCQFQIVFDMIKSAYTKTNPFPLMSFLRGINASLNQILFREDSILTCCASQGYTNPLSKVI